MPDPLERSDEEAAALAFVADEARRYLAELDDAPCARQQGAAVRRLACPKTATAR